MYCAIQEDRYMYTYSSDVSTYKYCTVLYERIGMYIHSWIFFNLVCIRMAYTGISLTGILPYIYYIPYFLLDSLLMIPPLFMHYTIYSGMRQNYRNSVLTLLPTALYV